jgi:hypothetical protein
MANGSDNLTHRRLRGLDHKLDNLIDMVRDMVRDLDSRMTVFETRMTTLETSIHSNITTVFERLDRIQIRLDWIERGGGSVLGLNYSRRQLLAKERPTAVAAE